MIDAAPPSGEEENEIWGGQGKTTTQIYWDSGLKNIDATNRPIKVFMVASKKELWVTAERVISMKTCLRMIDISL